LLLGTWVETGRKRKNCKEKKGEKGEKRQGRAAEWGVVLRFKSTRREKKKNGGKKGRKKGRGSSLVYSSIPPKKEKRRDGERRGDGMVAQLRPVPTSLHILPRLFATSKGKERRREQGERGGERAAG